MSKPAEDTKPPALSPIFMSPAEARRLVYAAEIPENVTVDRIRDPDYWAHCEPKLREGFIIEAQRIDNAWRAVLMVRKVDPKRHEVHTWLLQYTDLASQVAQEAAPVAEQFAVRFGGAHKWRVIRLSDNEIVHHGEPTEADAKAWLSMHLQGRVPA